MAWIERNDYLNFLLSHKDKNIIKVVSGIRRCGKSTLFDIYIDYLLKHGVEKIQIININLEDLFYQGRDYKELYFYIKNKLVPGKRNYIFLDEVQNCAGFEKMVDSLLIQPNTDIYLTGSNAYFRSSELATFLSGRYVELKRLPLSFREYVSAFSGNQSLLSLYNQYITLSSFPYALQYHGDVKAIKDYLQGLYSTILLKDVIQRYHISDVRVLESVISFVFDNIGNRLNPYKISNTLSSNGRKVNEKTIEKYLQALRDSLLIYQVKRYNVKGRGRLKSQEKYYVADLGLRNLFCGIKGQDEGHILENVIYLELLRRGYQVRIGQNETNEIDFVAKNSEDTYFIQVSLTMKDKTTYQREIKPLKTLKNNYPKRILTRDESPVKDDNGIKIIYALDWLRDKKQLSISQSA